MDMAAREFLEPNIDDSSMSSEALCSEVDLVSEEMVLSSLRQRRRDLTFDTRCAPRVRSEEISLEAIQTGCEEKEKRVRS